MEIINVLGEPCPIPVIKTTKALKIVDSVRVLVDNFVAVQNLEKMAKGNGYVFSYIEKSKTEYEITILRDGAEVPVEKEKIVAVNNNTNNFSVIIGQNTMGSGDEELGKILIKGFIFSLTQLEVVPKNLVFFNSGAFLSCENSNVLEDLKILENLGTKIFTCGTCVNFYKLSLSIGEITDMYNITEIMANSGKVINI